MFLPQDTGKHQGVLVVNEPLRSQVGLTYLGVLCFHISLQNTYLLMYMWQSPFYYYYYYDDDDDDARMLHRLVLNKYIFNL